MGSPSESGVKQTGGAQQVMKGRMSVEGRQFKKPSQQEIYRDAARIVEELLYARLDKNKLDDLHGNFARSASYQAASSENVLSEEVPDVNECNGDDEHLVRSQTAPSRFKWDFKGKDKKLKKSRSRAGSKSKKTQDEENKQMNVEFRASERGREGSKSRKSQDGESKQSGGASPPSPSPPTRSESGLAKGDYRSSDERSHYNTNVERKSSMSQKKKAVNGYLSSSESDGEGTNKKSTTLRRKKSFFKKAKERFMNTFHRDEKSDDDDIYIHGPEKEKKKKRWKHKKDDRLESLAGGDVSGNATVHADVDLSLKMNDPADGNEHQAGHDVSLRRNSAGKRFLNSVRKSFRLKKKSDVAMMELNSADPITTDDSKDLPRSSSMPDDRTGLLHLEAQCGGREERKLSMSGHDDQSSRDQSPRDQSVSVKPGQTRHRHATISEEDADNTWDETYVKTDDGLWEKNRSDCRFEEKKDNILPQGSIETDGHNEDESDGKSPQSEGKPEEQDIPYDQKSDAEKEEVIAKVVQKLIEIGDNIASHSHSDSESRSHRSPSPQPNTSAAAAAAPGDDALTSLEREILMCLRVGGDRLSETMPDPTAGLVEEAKQSVYDQFTQTIRRTVGDEVNWHQMALVFHASRTALNVVGIGTDKARRLKDLTIKYVTDKCASWIYEQGGWESVVSEDSDLD